MDGMAPHGVRAAGLTTRTWVPGDPYRASMLRAGTPTTRVLDGTSRRTTEPAPTVQPSPMRRRGRTRQPTPSRQSAPMLVEPATTEPGATWVLRPITQSCSMIAPVLMMAWASTLAKLWTTARGPTKTPTPSAALGAMTAEGWTTGSAVEGVLRAAINSARTWTSPTQRIHALDDGASRSPPSRDRPRRVIAGASARSSSTPRIGRLRARQASATTKACPPAPMRMSGAAAMGC